LGTASAMTRWTRLPLRLRLALVFAAGTTLVLLTVGVFVYQRTAADLLDTVDAGLRSRAEILVADVRAHGPALADVGSSLIESDEAFAQIADAGGVVVQSSEIVRGSSLLSSDVLVSLGSPTLFDRNVPGIDNTTRVLAVPVAASSGRAVVVVGSSLQDRADQLLQLAATLGVGTPVAVILISLAGWLLAGAALRPVERMRREAAAISMTDPASRLTLPVADDEILRLGVTLNAMLDRIQASIERELRFVDDASHELRTPLSILKAELDLALARPRSAVEMEAALRSASEETDHLVRLAEDLLVLARAHGGRLPVQEERTDLRELLQGIANRHGPRAVTAGVEITVEAPKAFAHVDAARLRQAIDDLLDNAVRHTPRGGRIQVSGERDAGSVRFAVQDSGPGFTEESLQRAFEPFARDGGVQNDGGSGLGLAIVRVIAEAHGGSANVENVASGGARVSLVVRDLA
jgi:two-component system, OmpR family, sensor kinase